MILCKATHFPVLLATEIYSYFQTKGLTIFILSLTRSLPHALSPSFFFTVSPSFFFLFERLQIHMSQHFLLMPQKNALDSKSENRNNCIYFKLAEDMHLLQCQPHSPKKQNPLNIPKTFDFLVRKISRLSKKRVFSK